MKRREFVGAAVASAVSMMSGRTPHARDGGSSGVVSAAVRVETASRCAGTKIAQVACELFRTAPGRPAWSEPLIGVDSLNAKVHHWGEPKPGQPVLGGRPPFTAPNVIRDDYNILDWPGKALWDPVQGDWWFSGGPTGNQDPASPTIVRYRPADDRFVHWQGMASKQGGIWPPSGHAHSFDAADLDARGRRLWRHLTSHASEPYGFKLGWFDIDTFPPATRRQRQHPALRRGQLELGRRTAARPSGQRGPVLLPSRRDLLHHEPRAVGAHPSGRQGAGMPPDAGHHEPASERRCSLRDPVSARRPPLCVLRERRHLALRATVRRVGRHAARSHRLVASRWRPEDLGTQPAVAILRRAGCCDRCRALLRDAPRPAGTRTRRKGVGLEAIASPGRRAPES